MKSVIITILVFGLIIFIHELGHFIAAKKCGVKVNEFALGMGPKLISKVKGETRYSLRLLPIGGFVSMEGEDTKSDNPNAFSKKPILSRFIIVVAGAIMNLILGFVILVLIYSFSANISTNIVTKFKDDAVSSSSGLQVDDEILSINSRKTFTDNDIISEILSDDDGVMDFVVRRNGEKVTLENVTFETVITDESKELNIDFYVRAEENSFLNTLDYSFRRAISMGRLVWISLVQLVSGQVSFSQLSGPVGAGAALGNAASIGLDYLATLVAFLSINIGLFNLLPLPALDGGRLLFIIIEAIRRKAINPKYEAYVHGAGILLLLGLMVVITFKDIINLF